MPSANASRASPETRSKTRAAFLFEVFRLTASSLGSPQDGVILWREGDVHEGSDPHATLGQSRCPRCEEDRNAILAHIISRTVGDPCCQDLPGLGTSALCPGTVPVRLVQHEEQGSNRTSCTT